MVICILTCLEKPVRQINEIIKNEDPEIKCLDVELKKTASTIYNVLISLTDSLYMNTPYLKIFHMNDCKLKL